MTSAMQMADSRRWLGESAGAYRSHSCSRQWHAAVARRARTQRQTEATPFVGGGVEFRIVRGEHDGPEQLQLLRRRDGAVLRERHRLHSSVQPGRPSRPGLLRHEHPADVGLPASAVPRRRDVDRRGPALRFDSRVRERRGMRSLDDRRGPHDRRCTPLDAGTPPCGPDTCGGGCCDGSGMCRAGGFDQFCGNGGAACIDCTGTGGSCVNRACLGPVDASTSE